MAGGPVRRVAEAVEGSIDSAAGLPDFQRELLEHMRSMDEGIQSLAREMSAVRDDIAAVRASLGPSAEDEFKAMNASMTRVETRIEHIDEQIPDPDAPSPIEKAKDALLGDNDKAEE
ncbi:MAG TPA: hypothetical protein VFY44_12685 [Thermoleophilaceae bacterium]|nr:hypothetical protein [Thermoleophilaceae bacterium]